MFLRTVRYPTARALVAVATIAAVAQSGSLPAATLASRSHDSTTLNIWTEQYSGGMTGLQRAIKDFEAANPGVTVTLTTHSTDGHKEALRVAMNTPAEPDIFQMWGGVGLGGFYVQSGGVLPLDSYYARYHWNDRFYKASVAAATILGHPYGVPFNVHAMGLYYRKDLFAKAGITSTPTTYAQLLADNAKLRAAGITPLSLGGKFGWNTMRLVDSLLETECGAALFDRLRNLQASWANQPCVTKGFTDLKQWDSLGYLPKSFLGIDPTGMYVPVFKGQAAMTLDGDWAVGEIQQAGMDTNNYSFFVFPTGTRRLSFFIEMLMIARNSKHQALAAKFLDYVTSPAVQSKYYGQLNGAIPPVPAAKSPTPQPALAGAWQKAFAQYPNIYLPSDQALPAALVNNVYFVITDKVVSGSLAPQDAGKQFQAAVAKYKKG